MDKAMPLFHASKVMAVEGMSDDWRARVLFLRNGSGPAMPYGELLEYMQDHSGKSPTWQDTVARGVGLFWDFWIAAGPVVRAEGRPDFQRSLFKRFCHALEGGTISADGSDSTKLYWPRMSWDRALTLVRSLESFMTWCHERQCNEKPDVDVQFRPPKSGSDLTDNFVWARIRQTSMMVHLKRRNQGYRTGRNGIFRTDPVGPSVEPYKFFPPNKAEDLLWIGHLRPNKQLSTDFFERYNVRDIMIALLQGWGGLRRSEPFHLWEQDVVEEPDRPNHALVVLNHPSEAEVVLQDKLTGRSKRFTRHDALKYHFAPFLPRHNLRNRLRAGWKDLDLNADKQAFVFWIDPIAAQLFWLLYIGYIRHIREPIMRQRINLGGTNHPFLFVTEGADKSDKPTMPGEPYSPKAHERNHKAAVERIGLIHQRYLGTTTHGLRHLYGQTLQNLGLPPQVIKKGLHHRHYLSQIPYCTPDSKHINDLLNTAYQKTRGGTTVSVVPLMHASSLTLRDISDRIRGGEINGR